MPYAYFEIINAPPPGWGSRLEGVKGQLDELRGQVSGAAQAKLEEVRGRLDELVAQVPRPEHPIETPADWLDLVRTRVGEIRAQLPAQAQRVADEIRARLDALRAALPSPEQPIELPPNWQQRVDQVRAQLDQLRGQLQGGGAQAAVEEVRRRVEELRGQFDRAELEARLAEVHGRLDELRGQATGGAQQVVDEIKRRVEELRASLPEPAHPIELPADINDKIAAIKVRLEELRGQGSGAVRARLDEVLAEVEGKAFGVFFIPGGGFRYVVLDANAVLAVGESGGGRRPTLY